jgi:hypothetical protein
MYYLLHRNQLHVSALFIGRLQVDNEKISSYTRFACVVYSGEVKCEVGTRSRMRDLVPTSPFTSPLYTTHENRA